MSQREVTGTITPTTALGIYDQIEDYNGKSRWKHQSQNWWIVWSSPLWFVADDAVLAPIPDSWYRIDASELGAYTGNVGTTGVATVSEYVAGLSIPIAMYHYRRRR